MLRPSPLPHARARPTRPAFRLLAAVLAALLLVLTTSVAGLAPSAGAAPASLGPQQPLVPRIRSITPDYLPAKGPIVVRGAVTNASDQTWTSINVHAFMGTSPITTSSALAAAASTPVNADVGPRITETGTFDRIPRLAPGQRARFTITLPHKDLPVSSSGVYWFGVHVLGDNGHGDLQMAVGRDRTFLAYVPAAEAAGAHEDTALVVPVRSGVARGPDGTVINPGEWTTNLTAGTLHTAVAIGQAAQGRPLTWLVDPAVPDTVRVLADGNPGRALATHGQPGATTSPSPSPSRSPSASSSGEGASATSAASTPARHTARQWLHAFRALVAAPSSEALGLPYGDLALETASAYDQPLLRASYRHPGRVLTTWGVTPGPAASPPDGLTTPETISQLPNNTQVLLPDTTVRGSAPVVDRVDGHRVLLMSTGAAEGGPGPVAPESSLALRQRVLAEAALRLLGHRQPLVVELSVNGHHRLGPSFFSGLEVPWVQLTTVGAATAGAATPLEDTRLRTPSAAAPALGPRLYFLAQETLDAGGKLQAVVTHDHSVSRRLFAEVTGNASYTAAEDPALARYRMRGTARWVSRQLHAISISAPPSVTLASSSGRFSAVLSNDLDVPVTVRLRALSDSSMRISGTELVQLPAHGRTAVLLNASTSRRGVHNVTLELTTPDGRLIGAADEFPLRADQVSGLIWVIIGAGVGLLFAAIVVRLVRRVMRARRAPGRGAAESDVTPTPPELPPSAPPSAPPAARGDLRHAET